MLKGNRREYVVELFVAAGVGGTRSGSSENGGGGNIAYSLGGPVYAFSLEGSREIPFGIGTDRVDVEF